MFDFYEHAALASVLLWCMPRIPEPGATPVLLKTFILPKLIRTHTHTTPAAT